MRQLFSFSVDFSEKPILSVITSAEPLKIHFSWSVTLASPVWPRYNEVTDEILPNRDLCRPL